MLYPLLVFLAGCSYGMLAPISKLAYGIGFTVGEVVGAQSYFGLFMLAIINLMFFRPKIKLKSALLLMIIGSINALTGIVYGQALQTLSAAVAIIFLFQFTWIGILIEAIFRREWPSMAKLFSIPFLLAGSAIAGGIFELSKVNITLEAAFFGFLSAITFAMFIFLSGNIAVEIPALNRTFFFGIGAVITVSLIYPPHFFINGTIPKGLLFYAVPLSIFGSIIAPWFFAKGTPHIGSGLASILGASELPMAVLMAGILLGERVSFLRWIGITITLFGIGIPYLLLQLEKKIRAAQFPSR